MPEKNMQANRYVDQVVESTYGYLSGYRKARPIDEQITILKKELGPFLPVGFDWSLSEVQMQFLAKPAPQGSEGYFAVVFDTIMVTHFEDDPNVDQSAMVSLLMVILSQKHKDHQLSYSKDLLGPQYYRRSKKSAEKMKQLWESQGCPTGIILIPAQLGDEHRGKSIQCARMAIRGSEFPLDAPEGLQMVLTHENRFQHPDDLCLDFPGSEYSTVVDGALYVELGTDCAFGFNYRTIDRAFDHFGSATGFLLEEIDSLNPCT